MTTPKGDQPHYLFILSNMEPLGVDLKNMVCYRLGTVFYLYMQKWDQAMKKSEFKPDMGGTADCMNRTTEAIKGCGQLSSNNTFFLIPGSV